MHRPVLFLICFRFCFCFCFVLFCFCCFYWLLSFNGICAFTLWDFVSEGCSYFSHYLRWILQLKKCVGWKILMIMTSYHGYGNHDCKIHNLFMYTNSLTNYLTRNLRTKISWVMMHHVNKILQSEKSDHAPLTLLSGWLTEDLKCYSQIWCGRSTD